MLFSETIILSVGGSLIVPNGGISTKFLINFDRFIREQTAENKRRFVLVAGGGATARNYRDAGAKVSGGVTKEDLDWLGIHATRINGHLLRTIFKDIAYPKIIDDYENIENNIRESVIVAAGWIPGWSSDYCAVLAAKFYGAERIINLSNVEMVYTADPKSDKKAKPIRKMGWRQFRKLVGEDWDPGMNVPWDPVAAKGADELGLSVVVLKGSDFNNLRKAVDGKPFKGTVIS